MINQNNNRVYKVFVDFDGTITRQDIGEHMFLKFGDPDEANAIIKRWIDEEINSRESWKLLCNTIKKFDQSAFDEFIKTIEIDKTFHKFSEFCSVNNIEIFVLSDGLDYYIKRFLALHGIDNLKFFSNHMNLDDNGKIYPTFPYTDEECDRCANCKRNHIIQNSAESDYTFYIGDGYSDTCPVQYVDFIFAKKSLLKFCETNRISYYPFNSFNDVIDRMKDLLSRKRLRYRHQAELKRKEVYQQG